MAGVTEGVTIKGLIETQAVLNDLLDRVEDLSPLMAQIGAYGEESTRYRFESQKGPDGKTWEPSHRARAEGGQTLKKSGIFEGSITNQFGRDSAEWGTNWPWASVHQDGATIRAKGDGRLGFFIPGIGFRSPREVVIPARPMFGINDEDEDEISAIIHDYLAEAIP